MKVREEARARQTVCSVAGFSLSHSRGPALPSHLLPVCAKSLLLCSPWGQISSSTTCWPIIINTLLLVLQASQPSRLNRAVLRDSFQKARNSDTSLAGAGSTARMAWELGPHSRDAGTEGPLWAEEGAVQVEQHPSSGPQEAAPQGGLGAQVGPGGLRMDGEGPGQDGGLRNP